VVEGTSPGDGAQDQTVKPNAAVSHTVGTRGLIAENIGTLPGRPERFSARSLLSDAVAQWAPRSLLNKVDSTGRRNTSR
ncbi:hypothetical protein KAW64_12415, partial [bacterium]|nr:hypothetical protein [bacterium]